MLCSETPFRAKEGAAYRTTLLYCSRGKSAAAQVQQSISSQSQPPPRLSLCFNNHSSAIFMSTDKILCWVYKNCYKKAIIKVKVLAGMSAFFNKKNSHYIYLNKASCYRLFQLLKENKAWWKNNSPLNFMLPVPRPPPPRSHFMCKVTNTGGSSWNDMPSLVSLALFSKSLKKKKKPKTKF